MRLSLLQRFSQWSHAPAGQSHAVEGREVRFARDPPLEQTGFEPLVPEEIWTVVRRKRYREAT